MANRSLGQLTIDLVAKIGGFTAGMTEAERVADRKGREIKKRLDAQAKSIETAWGGIGAAITAGIAGISVGTVIAKVIQETKQAELEQAQLAAVLRSTGNAAGWTQDQLNDMADAMEKRSIFSGGDINQAQTRLLSYTGIVGEQFPQAMQAAIDMAARMGMDVSSAAETVGRALDSPKDGLTALSKQGFRFTDDQKALVEQLQKTGKTAEAQKIILAALESSYGGAAEAARNTLGGAITALQNQLDSLLTGDSGSLQQTKDAINDLTRTLSSAETQAAFQTLIGWTAKLAKALTELASNEIFSLVMAGKYSTGAVDFADNILAPLVLAAGNTELALKRAQSSLAQFEQSKARAERNGWDTTGDQKAIDDLTRRIAYLRSVVNRDLDKKNQSLLDNYVPRRTVAASPGSVVPDATGAAAAAKAAEEAERKRQQALAKSLALAEQQAKKASDYLQDLRDQNAQVKEMTALEKLHYDMLEGNVVLYGTQYDAARDLAVRIDETKKKEEERKKAVDQLNSLYAIQNELIAEGQGYLAALDSYGMGNKAAQEMQARVQIQQRAAAELRKLEQDRQSDVLTNPDNADAINANYAAQSQALNDALNTRLGMYDDYILQVRQREGDWQAGAISGLQTYLENARDVYSQTQQIVTNAFGTMEDTVYDFLTTGTLDLGSMFRSIGQEVLRMLIRIGIQMAAQKLLGDAMQAAGVVTATAAGTATAAAWAPAAAMASLASFGGNAAPAMAGISATTGLAETLSLMSGFADGGFTGSGGKYDPAGIVHAGEFVITKAATSRLGLDYLNSLNRGYADGGYVGTPPAATRRDWSKDRANGQTVNVIEDASKAGTVEQSTDENGDDQIDVFVSNIARGGRAAQALQTYYGLRRQGR